MDKYRYQPPLQRQKELTDSRKRKPSLDDERRGRPTFKKMKLDKEKENGNGSINNTNNDSSNSNSSQGQGSTRRSRSPRAGFDPPTSNAHKTPFLKLPPPRSRVDNWRLACFMAREYLSRGTLLGKPWPPQDSNTAPPEDTTGKPKLKLSQGEETEREKERLYSILTTDFLRSDDVHIPRVLNPSQLADWLGYK